MTDLKSNAIQWAISVIADDQTVFIDCETCGIEHSSPVVDIAIVNRHGAVLLESLVNPGVPIPAEATAVHGIGDDDVRHAPRFVDLYPQLDAILDGVTALAWNSGYDASIIAYRCKVAGLPQFRCQWQDAMKAYGDFDGTVDPRFSKPKMKWWKLDLAAAHFGIPAGGHRAKQDALTCLAVVRALSEVKP